ncbi:uncharacterized protein PHACADRAFT_249169 [Phanerochaete carnosa HHB-10118-sp]|uniref:VWFA domain-containing protein n=1 Tax=Phanerochaete carnosa (strain HHB-10118-sp) TaxID=650164 RepID=K5W536_PHACS|nr:uncharacterized protein PHACADRAFT_249169 [Phanerochaete carnosa HHB-10118-sp]EKM59013.1 hypothetical protein PHACADRAFT_249169 [Phanerochaete carnosa HHB-10118-sp]
MRNGDYQPARFEAQVDAVNTVFQTKVDSNPENLVGLMTMSGKSPEVLATNTKEQGQILNGLHAAQSKIGGASDIPTAISVAQLALKHRQNKNLRQRIIVFIGSPLVDQGADEKNMVRLAKKLKKNSVAVDIVAFGEAVEDACAGVLKAFIENVSQGENSHLVTVAPGPHLLSDMIISSPILAGDRGIPEEILAETGGAASGAAGGFEFGVDPSLDPELAMALRMSMEEEQARQAAAAAAAAQAGQGSTAHEGAAVQPPSAPESTTVPAEPADDEEEAMLRQALAMSQGQDVEMQGDGDENISEEEAIARAIAMSMKPQEEQQDSKDKK